MPRAVAARAVEATPAPELVERPRLVVVPDPLPAGPLWIPAAEAAAYLGMTIEALKARAKEGRLGFREGGRWRFSLADLKRYTETIEHRHVRRFPRR